MRLFRSPSPLTVLLAFAVLYLLVRTLHPEPGRLDRTAAPHPVVARGELGADEQNTISVFKEVSPSVVYITSIAVERQLDWFSLNVYEIPKEGAGSGFVWDKQGRIVTNFHVISDASRIKVTLADHTTWKAAFVGAAPDRDLAVLQISAPADKLRPIMVGESDNLQVGQKVLAIGNPFGLDRTLTVGVVSALGREIQSVTKRAIRNVIQTDAAINPGNSGGPLLDSAGRLIGINTAIYSPSGTSAGVGFAVPVHEINRVVPQIIRHGKLLRPSLGLSFVNQRITHELDLDGLLVLNVEPGSSADKAGIRGTRQARGGFVLGDIIVAVNGIRVEDYEQFQDELEKHEAGDTVTLTMLRENGQVDVKVMLEE